ncbi:MAG TPA: c-type cytochrome, partial [Thermoguttaceae bacterium]|nr:c-type cytochrome [Thermoguttaceae bacterium]
CALSHGVDAPERGVTLGPPADPVGFYDAARPEWAFLGLYGFSKLDVFAGDTIVPIFVIPGAVVLFFVLMPWIGRVRFGRLPLGHALNIVVLVVLLVGNVWLSFKVVAQDRADELHQRAIRENRLAAERMLTLIAHRGGIPPAGALELLHNDPKTQGPILFRRHCATCHDYVGQSPDDIKAEESTAPNLFAYGSRRWLSGLLDPKRIVGPEYFGNTAFKRGEMAQFVRDTFSDLEPEDREELDQIVMTLSAEAKLPAQSEMDRKDAIKIAEGRALIGGNEGYCTDCHQFGDSGQLGIAPQLNGYASREWMIGIVRNPADPRFYGAKNDRMQAYGAADDESKNLLTDREIELLIDWLRGDWVEAAGSRQ